MWIQKIDIDDFIYKAEIETKYQTRGFPDISVSKESACTAGDPVQFLGWEDLLEKGRVTRFCILGLPWWLSW